MRWTQMQLGETVPHCGTAVAIDVGDHRDIHPKDKKTVGERLARLALARTYGATDLAESGPVPKAVKVRRVSPDAPVEFDTVFVNYLEDTLVVEFDNEKGLSTSDGKEVRGFQVTDGQFTVPVDATIEIRGGRSVVVLDHDDLSLLSWTPTAVRYAWDDYPDCNLVNGEGLPCGPFELKATILDVK
jgi:sialate O-acetylesterase